LRYPSKTGSSWISGFDVRSGISTEPIFLKNLLMDYHNPPLRYLLGESLAIPHIPMGILGLTFDNHRFQTNHFSSGTIKLKKLGWDQRNR